MTANPKKELLAQRLDVALDAILPDEKNRNVAAEADANGDEWQEFVTSIKVHGVKHPIILADVGDGTYQLFHGERRWRGSRAAGRTTVPAEVYPPGTTKTQLIELGLMLNLQTKPLGCLETSDALRRLRNEQGCTVETIATRIGLPVDKVKQYLTLSEASDRVYAFIAEHQLPLRVALELVRFDKKGGELATRKLLALFADEPPTVALIKAERAKLEKERTGEGEESTPRASRSTAFGPKVVAAFAKDRSAALAELEAIVQQLGFKLLPADQVG